MRQCVNTLLNKLVPSHAAVLSTVTMARSVGVRKTKQQGIWTASGWCRWTARLVSVAGRRRDRNCGLPDSRGVARVFDCVRASPSLCVVWQSTSEPRGSVAGWRGVVSNTGLSLDVRPPT